MSRSPLSFLKEGEQSKTCVVPKAFRVIVDIDSGPIDVKEGTQELPEAIYGHWFAINMGVGVYGAAPVVKEAAPVVEEEVAVAPAPKATTRKKA